VKLKPKYRRVMIDVLAVTIVVASVAGIYFGLQIALATPTPWVVVASGSMNPSLEVGDLVIVQGIPPSDIHVEDIIIFGLPQGSRTIHRVKRIQTLQNGTFQFKTKGDANSSEDAYWVSEQDVQGRVLYRIPYLGWMALEPTIPIIIVIASIIIILVWPEDTRKKDDKGRMHPRRKWSLIAFTKLGPRA